MNNKSINQEDHLPFPLFNQRFFSEFSQDSKLIGHLNQEMLHLNHKCSYKWMNQPKLEWTLDNDIKILVITWNMHGMIPGYSLKRLFNIEQVHHDLIVIGTQECSRSIAVSLLCESKGDWESKLKEELGKDYVKVISSTLNAMHLIVFSHVLLVPKIKNGRPYTLSQGFMGIVGNKGGIAISVIVYLFYIIKQYLYLYSIELLNQYKNLYIYTIILMIKYSYLQIAILKVDKMQKLKGKLNFLNLKLILKMKHSLVIKMYHMIIQYGLVILIQEQIKKLQLKLLDIILIFLNGFQMIKYYQSQFQEGMIFFPPTYKLLEYQNQWAVEKDFRIPGWCDRILFKENKKTKSSSTTQGFNQNVPQQIQLQNYDANFDILGSDHRPVFAQFTVSFQ